MQIFGIVLFLLFSFGATVALFAHRFPHKVRCTGFASWVTAWSMAVYLVFTS